MRARARAGLPGWGVCVWGGEGWVTGAPSPCGVGGGQVRAVEYAVALVHSGAPALCDGHPVRASGSPATPGTPAGGCARGRRASARAPAPIRPRSGLPRLRPAAVH